MFKPGRLLSILAGVLFIAGGLIPWAQITNDTETLKFNSAGSTPIILTGCAIILVSLIFVKKPTRLFFGLVALAGLGWSAYTIFLLIVFFDNGPQYARNLVQVSLEPGLFLTLGASILGIAVGLFQFGRAKKLIRSDK